MKIFLSCLLVLMICTGCSCTPGGSTASPSPSPSASADPSPSPSPEAQTMTATVKEYIDYLAEEYTLSDPAPIENLDGNALDGYTFGLNNDSYYLVLLDPSSASAAQWMNDIGANGQIDVDIDGLTKTMNALINGNYVLLSSSNNYANGFKEYYDAFSGSQALPQMNTPGTSPDANNAQ